ncbi:MAG: SET domain-containing protein [Alphaproteobacteria bacterium]
MSFTVWDLVEVRPCGADDRGLYARRDIRRGEVIGSFDGRATLLGIGPDGRLETGGYAFKDLIQLRRVGDSVLVLAPVDGFEGVDFTNHSCQPNAAVQQGVVLVARRKIKAGEQITMDYRRMDVVPEGIDCWCQTEQNCRI